MQLTKPQQNILSTVVEMTVKTKGKNKGDIKDVISSESFDGRSFGALARLGLVEFYDGVLGSGVVATRKGAALILNK